MKTSFLGKLFFPISLTQREIIDLNDFVGFVDLNLITSEKILTLYNLF